jgi:type IV pilus assembly protein PilP
MLKKMIKQCWIAIIVFLLAGFSGCGKQDEKAPPPGAVKSFKIDKTEPSSDIKPPETPVAGSGPSGVTSPGEGAKPSGDNFVATEPVTKGAGMPPVTSPMPVTGKEAGNSAANSSVTAGTSVLEGGGIKTEMELTYKPAGRVDPFEPLFQIKGDKSISGRGHSTLRDSRKDKLTPLEKLDISQLKLTAIITGPQNIAMVQEATGKGYVVKKGTYIGINSGRIVEINKNEIIIEEEVEDILGKIVVRKRELKLQKPLGEM